MGGRKQLATNHLRRRLIAVSGTAPKSPVVQPHYTRARFSAPGRGPASPMTQAMPAEPAPSVTQAIDSLVEIVRRVTTPAQFSSIVEQWEAAVTPAWPTPPGAGRPAVRSRPRPRAKRR